jgi:UDP-N-acetylglucosamine:LPS N-acetylglucosamine transferase
LTTLRKNLGRRLGRLDPTGRFRSRFAVELSQLGEPADSDGKPPLITFAVGGAGAQAELARQFLPGLKRLVENGKLRLCLVAGVRGEVAKEFREALAENRMSGVEILHEPTLDEYFKKFHERLGDTDILWTKPSEMTFFAALGLPLIMAPPVGVHERYNRRWAAEAGAGLFQHDVRFAGEWLEAYLADGTLAGAAWAGFRRLPQLGLYDICDAVTNSRDA